MKSSRNAGASAPNRRSKPANVVKATTTAIALTATMSAMLLQAAAAHASATTYVPQTPQLATITNGTSAAPWNEWQGDQGDPLYWSANGSPSSSTGAPGTVLPKYVPGGSTISGTSTSVGNLSVMPDAGSGTAGVSPYPSGVVGTPGPLAGYCGTGNNTAESSQSPSRQPDGTTLPLAPAYFPHIVRNSDGSLTGYFDYRPKDADEAVVVANSTDDGQTWTYEGEALEQNAGYCPTGDINDDGNGHPFSLSVAGNSYLYTLQRAAGDQQGVGLLVHTLNTNSDNPLSSVPAKEQVGIDPDGFDTDAGGVPIPASGNGATIDLTTTGSAGSTEQLVAGGFVDLTLAQQGTDPIDAADVIKCAGVTLGTPGSLTGCTAPSGETINDGDLIEQVIGYVGGNSSKKSTGTTVAVGPGPNKTDGSGGVSLWVVPTPTTTGTGSSVEGFTDAITGTTFNANAPNRAYIDGTAVYCPQSDANPTGQVEDCTTGPGGITFTPAIGDPITSDPVIPATATAMTTGLVSPDGIVGELPTYPVSDSSQVPASAKFVMYTEKELNYYIAGTTTNASSATFSSGVTFTAGQYIADDMPAASSVSASNPVTIDMGDIGVGGGSEVSIVAVTYTKATVSGSTWTLSNPTSIQNAAGNTTNATPELSDDYNKTSLVGAPGAAVVSYQILAQTGEGAGSITADTNGTYSYGAPSAKNVAKLMKNNEDLAVVRVAWTTDGINFSDAGLANCGIISGGGPSDCDNASGSNSTDGTDGTSSYDDLTNSSQQTSPSNLNAYAAAGAALATEERWAGSGGTIITNPDGSIGLFLSGSWAADGDSDAFNQVWYSSSTDGEHWTVPTSVVSTDYTFSASAKQDSDLSQGTDSPLGISAYYSGRAYGPSVVQDSDGGLTMIFAGYRIPKTIASAGTILGTDSADPYTIGSGDPTAYRNILVDKLLTQSTGIQFGAPNGGQGTYGGQATLSATGGGPSSPVTFSVDSSSTAGVCSISGTTVSYTGVGSCVIDANQDAGTGYTAVAQAQQTVNIAPAALTITASSPSMTYGGSVPQITPGYQGLANGDTAPTTAPTCATQATSSSSVGSYDTSCSGASDPDYAITYVDGSLTVGPAPLTVTASGGSMVYGGSGRSTITASYSNFANGDVALNTAPTCSITLASNSPVGSYSNGSQCSGGVDPNYSITYVDGSVAVTPARLTITAPSSNVPYGSAVPALTPSYSGLVGTDTAASLTTAPTCTTTYKALDDLGSYPTTCSGAADPNYTISYTSGKLTVVQASSTTTLTLGPQLKLGPILLPPLAEITVSAAGVTPTGIVELLEDGHLIAILPLLHGSTAFPVLPSLWSIGLSTHKLSAVYLGDSEIAGSTSQTLTFSSY